MILYLQGIVYPLQKLNAEFAEWAKEKRIEASMTSQVFKLEWFLNRKFRKFFEDSNGKISIDRIVPIGVPFYSQGVNDSGSPVVFAANEDSGTNLVLYGIGDATLKYQTSFVVNSPRINTSLISEEDYLMLLKYWVDKYKLSGKTYIINI